MKKIPLLILTILSLFLPAILYADTFSFRHYKSEDGLTSNTVSCIIQDRHGFIWIGTEGCLNRFDGHSFKEFSNTKNGKVMLWGNYITSLLEVKNGDIWIGADDGIYIYHPNTEVITRFALKADNVGITSYIYNMVEDAFGSVWIATYGQGVFQYHSRTNKLEQYRILVNGASSKTYDNVNYVYVDRSNQVWVAPKPPLNALITFDRSKNCFRDFDFKESKKITVYKIFEDSQRNMWLGTWDKGICLLDKKEKTITKYLSPENGVGILHIHEICEYKPNVLLIGSDDGLSLFNTITGRQQLFTSSEIDPSSISDKFVYPILKDQEGGIWIGTYFGGINYISPNSSLFERFTHSRYVNSVNGNVIGGFTEDKKGNIWMASDDGGLNCLNPKTRRFSNYMPQKGKNSISYHNVHALCWDEDKLWIGTYTGGLNVLNIKTGIFKVYNSIESNPRTIDKGSIYSIFKDRNNRIWVGSMLGVNLYNPSTDDFTRVKQFNSTTIDIKQDQKGYIWFATQGKGMFRFNPQTNQWRNFTCMPGKDGSLPSNQLNIISFDQKGQLWIGTTNGLCRYDYVKEKFITLSLNIPNNNICGIIQDNTNLWLTTSKGLVRYNTLNNDCQVFTRSDGLMSDIFLANSCFKSSTGEIYIGTANGFNTFCPKNLVTNKYIPPVTLTGLEIFNKEVEIGPNSPLTKSINSMKQIDLSYKENVFSLSYAALSYITPEKNMYAYKLEGFDKNWNYVKQHKATYTNLPAGKYVFRVKASNNDGLWNDQGTSILIVIHPPFWLTTGFQLIYFLLAVLGLFLLVRNTRLRAERRHNEELKELSQQKEKEVYNAKIQFFTMIAHEIRTPVSLIIGPLEKIMTALNSFPDLIRHDLNIIDRNSQRLLQLVNQLLDFRKVEQGALILNFNQQNIYQLLCSVTDRFKPMMEQKQISFTFDCPNKEFEAMIDQEAITKVVSNLLTNAMKFTTNKIDVRCNVLPESESFEIEVQDNGNGISDFEKEKIFTPFYQVPSENKQGTGIGLSLVKSITEAHHGRVKVTDSPISGAIFNINIPLKTSKISGNEEIQKNSQVILPVLPLALSQPENSIKDDKTDKQVLLIVEDNADMRSFLATNFDIDYVVLTANDGIEALELLKKSEVNLIISDLMMPRMDGLEFCKAIRSNILFSHIPFVLLTARTDLDTKIDGLNLGADSYIEKPFSIHHLKAQINNLIESRRLLRKKYSEMPLVSITTIAGNSADELFLTKVKDIIEQNISNEDFSIDLLAEALFISRSGLFAKIKTLADITPNELIQLIRLKKAAEYLNQKEFRINEIAYMVGFNNPSYFSKCFQKQFGVRPMDFVGKTE